MPATTAPKKKKRAPSAFNLFMKKTIRQVKAENKSLSHTEAFTQAAKKWARSPENPKNKK